MTNNDKKINEVSAQLPLALVYGEAVVEIPQDLYIPPDALEVILEAFEGPLDLLLYLIRKQNIDILDIPVADITHQYMRYVELMKSIHLELAAEYLLMAAMLAEIKSRMLLPRSSSNEEEEEDPRAELIRRLQEYEQIKVAAEQIDQLQRLERDIIQVQLEVPEFNTQKTHPEVAMQDLLIAITEVLKRADLFDQHHVKPEILSTRERMTSILETIHHRGFVPFIELFKAEEGRLGVVVTFIAVLELVKESLIDLIQNEPFAPIHIRSRVEDSTDGSI